jgi:hypothetical protein
MLLFSITLPILPKLEDPGALMHTVKYRMVDSRLRPRQTKLEVPGWAGQREPRKDGSHEYAWHCVPFSESARYGIEVFYPFDNELHVNTRDGNLVLKGDSGPDPNTGLQRPPSETSATSFTPTRFFWT